MSRLHLVSAICVCLCCLILPGLQTLAAAGEAAPPTLEELAKENASLRQEMEALKKLMQDILKPKDAAPADMTLIERVEALEKKTPPGKSPVLSSFKANIYGFIKLDGSYSTGRIYPGNYAMYVLSEGTRKNDDQFNLTANETRLGLDIAGPQTDGMITSGKIEFDFYGGGAENKSNPMLRQAYAKLDWPESSFSVLAGQTWDIISPLAPNSLNYLVLGCAGNAGYRRPQVQLTKKVDMQDCLLTLQGGIARTIGRTSGFDPGDSGEDAGFPTVEGRTALSFPLLTNQPTTIGVSGHYGEEEYDIDAGNRHVMFRSWSANVDVVMPLVPKMLSVRGEAFTGDNLNAFVAGINQGVNTTAGSSREITTHGGWFAFSFTPPARAPEGAPAPESPWEFNVGAGVDNPSDTDLTGMANAATRNQAVFVNSIYKINKATTVGLEVSKWKTDYNDRASGDAFRFESALKYSF
ncbi:MAG TPA: hypothetical protein VM141_01880, partial [Planctomycetota bacterium]|nr:hypothetical protein [Planctomycetota bacterium]